MNKCRYYILTRYDGKYWDFKNCTWVEEVNDFCKIPDSLQKLAEVMKEMDYCVWIEER